ncbi:MAG: VanZ family protein [Woeseiaceae bacterium]|nr:VanZ family protein [Woeseiaceae bacterium]
MLPLRFARRWQVAGVFLLVLVLAFALAPPDWFRSRNLDSLVEISDKWLHGATFTLLALWFSGQYAARSYWRLALGLAAFGLLIEITQRMVSYRSAEWMDLGADLVGIGIGFVIALAGAGGWCLRFEEWLNKRIG